MFVKRVILTQKGKLRILIDSESLDEFLSAESESAKKLLKYSKYAGAQLFDFIRSPFDTKHPELQKVVEFRKRYDKNNDLTEIVKDDSRSRIVVRDKMDDIKITANKVYGKGSLTKSEKESVLLVFIQEILYRLTTTDLLITNNEIIVKNRLWFESHFPGSPVNIMTTTKHYNFWTCLQNTKRLTIFHRILLVIGVYGICIHLRRKYQIFSFLGVLWFMALR